jgi:hypothetical protein
MQSDYGRELGLLRAVIQGTEERPIHFLDVTPDYLRSEGMVWALPGSGGTVIFSRDAYDAFDSLTQALVKECQGLDRGIDFRRIRREIFTVIESHIGSAPALLLSNDVTALVAQLRKWFQHEVEPRKVFVPCAISPWPAPQFMIGPVLFIYVDDVPQSTFCLGSDDLIGKLDFDKMLERMRTERAFWLAQISVEGCDHERGEEIGALAVDLAIVTLQLALPTSWHTRNMSRLDARRGGADSQTLSRTATTVCSGHSTRDAGLTIGQGSMQDILQNCSLLVESVGRCVTAFATGRFTFHSLEQAWCDAAYWYHEALAERIDSIAIAKLETSLEVLLQATNTKGSQRRIRLVLEAFFNLKPEDPIVSGSHMTADEFAKSIVENRSKILHGVMSTLQPHIGIDRDGLEEFVASVLRRAVIELAGYRSSPAPQDKIEEFLKWVKSKSTSQPGDSDVVL